MLRYYVFLYYRRLGLLFAMLCELELKALWSEASDVDNLVLRDAVGGECTVLG